MLQDDAVEAIMQLANLADLKCVEDENSAPTNLDVIFLCKDHAKQRWVSEWVSERVSEWVGGWVNWIELNLVYLHTKHIKAHHRLFHV